MVSRERFAVTSVTSSAFRFKGGEMSNASAEKRQALDDIEALLKDLGDNDETPWKLIRHHLRLGLNTRTLQSLHSRIKILADGGTDQSE